MELFTDLGLGFATAFSPFNLEGVELKTR